MRPAEINKLVKQREQLFEKLAFYNNPPMFCAINYESHKKRIVGRLHKIAEVMYKELNIDKNNHAL